VIRITPEASEDPTTPPDERARGLEMAEKLPMRVLSRMWQMLLKAIEEVGLAPNAMMAAEMAIIRLTHVADLPDPETLIRRLQSQAAPSGGAPAGGGGGGGVVHGAVHGAMMRAPSAPMRGPSMAGSGGQVLALAGQARVIATFDGVLDLIREKRDMKLLYEVEEGLRLVRYSPGRIEFEPAPGAAPDLAARLGQRLQAWTGDRWGVSVVSSGGGPTVAEARNAGRLKAEAEALQNPLVQAVMAAFPGARITEIRTAEEMTEAAAAEALPEVEDEWDPFEDG
jgi:DNA polymerase-3 subunit gamma/tau